MSRRKVEIVEFCRSTLLTNDLQQREEDGLYGTTTEVQGIVITRFGLVRVFGLRYPVRYRRVVDGREIEGAHIRSFTRLIFVHCCGAVYPSRTYIREYRGRLYSRRYCTTLAHRFARDIAS